MRNMPLGQILKAQGIITESQLRDAIRIKQEEGSNKKLGDILIDLKYITENDLIKALSQRLEIPILDADIPNIPEAVIKLVPEQIARQYNIVPLELKGSYLHIATNDPLNFQALDDIKIVANKEIVPILATKKNISNALDRFYAGKHVRDMADSMSKSVLDEGVDEEEDEENADAASMQMEARIDNTPVAKIITTIISQAYAKGVSDIHIEPQEANVKVRLRQDGMLVDLMTIKHSVYKSVSTRIKILGEMNIAEKRIPQDGRFTYQLTETDKVDIRVSVLPIIYGEKIVMRLLGSMNQSIKTLKQLGMSDHNLKLFDAIIKNPNGIILMTGPTGSGKSTTLYSILSTVAKPELNVTTVEDPVEMNVKGINQVQTNSKAGLTFASALRSILRQDPDIIMIGEIRDSETGTIAIRAAITGHLVLSTLHTNDAASSITRLIDMGIEKYMVASSIAGVVAQRLVRKICPHCKATRPATEEDRIITGIDDLKTVAYGKGCDKCNNTGYAGRTAIHEILVVDEKMRMLINQDATVDQLREYAMSNGTLTLKNNMQEMVKNQITTVDELIKVAYSID